MWNSVTTHPWRPDSERRQGDGIENFSDALGVGREADARDLSRVLACGLVIRHSIEGIPEVAAS